MKRKKLHAPGRNLQDGDILSLKEAEYVEELEKLWDMVSETVEDGRLKEADIPDDYEAFVHQMVKLVKLNDQARRSIQ